MEYYTKEQLEKISIHRYDDLILEKFRIEDVDNLVADDGIEFVLIDADIFRQGVCQLFAYALSKKFGYKVYKIKSGASFHIFCKSDDESEYIDVRGKTSSFSEFIKGTYLLEKQVDDSEEYFFESSDFNAPFYDIGLVFAEAIICDDIERYAR